MNSERNPVRGLMAALALAAIFASTSVLAHADTVASGGQSPGTGFTVDGMWAAATCGFSMALARFDPGFLGSAVMICSYARILDA